MESCATLGNMHHTNKNVAPLENWRHTWKKVVHLKKTAPHLKKCGTIGICATHGKIPYNWKNAAHFVKCATLGVNRLATKGEKILLTTKKTRKKSPTRDQKIN